eukprot:8639181-Lingulodinium_polyedra.AAC.1
MKEVLGGKVGKVVVGGRVGASLCVLETPGYGWSATSLTVPKETMLVNPVHAIITELNKKASAGRSGKAVRGRIWRLFDASKLKYVGDVMYKIAARDLWRPGWRNEAGFSLEETAAE